MVVIYLLHWQGAVCKVKLTLLSKCQLFDISGGFYQTQVWFRLYVCVNIEKLVNLLVIIKNDTSSNYFRDSTSTFYYIVQELRLRWVEFWHLVINTKRCHNSPQRSLALRLSILYSINVLIINCCTHPIKYCIVFAVIIYLNSSYKYIQSNS